MSKSWCRLYSEFSHDPKIQSMSETMQRRFIMLMCLHTSNDNVTLHETEIAVALRISEEELAATKTLFLQKGFISEQWKLLKWEFRQFISDSSTSRVKKHRETKKKHNGNGTETLPKRPQTTDYRLKKTPNPLPDWIPTQDWNDWIDQRKKKPTERAILLAIAELKRLKDSGATPESVLRHCIMNGYQGIYPPKTNGFKSIEKPKMAHVAKI